MPSMTLRRAGQIVNRIKRETDQNPDDDYSPRRRRHQSSTTVLDPHVTINIDVASGILVDQARERLNAKRNRLFALMGIETRLRQAIAEKQSECGISGLITERVMVVKTQKILDDLLSATENDVYDATLFTSHVNGIRDRLKSTTTHIGSGGVQSNVTTIVLTASDRQELETQRNNTRRRLLEIDDRLAELNSTNSIEVRDEDVDFLGRNGLA